MAIKIYYILVNNEFFTVAFSPTGLARIDGPVADKPAHPKLLNQEGPNGLKVRNFFEAFFSQNFQLSDSLKNSISFDLAGTEFQQKVWLAIKSIPAGQVQNYQQVAKSIGHPKAYRAIGSACGRNPVPLLIPCHRVIASGGKLGGYSGKMEKKELLSKEGIYFPQYRSLF